MTQWEKNAYDVERVYGGYVDWTDRFYDCPWCGDMVYECDWSDEELKGVFCPICEATEEDDEGDE